MAIKTTVVADDSTNNTVKIKVEGVDDGTGGDNLNVRTELTVEDPADFKYVASSGKLHSDSDKRQLKFVWEEEWIVNVTYTYTVDLSCNGGSSTCTVKSFEMGNPANASSDNDQFSCKLK